MHNNIMAASSRGRPPTLAIGRYAQWRSGFLRYIDTRPNGDALRKCILEGPYTPSTVIIPAIPTIENSPAVPERTTVETILNMSPENKSHFESEKEAIHLILTGIGDEIYSNVDACKTAHEIHKGKEIAKPITPPSESASEEDSDPEQAQKDKEMQKNLALIAKLFGNQRIVNVARARETVGSQVVQQTGIQCFNCKEFGYFAKECRKPKRVKDSTYHKKKMLLCKQAEKGVQLQAEQSDWLADTNEEIDKQELEAHYNYMEKIREHSEQPESISNTCVVETGDSNVILDSSDMCDNDIQNDQNAKECDDERVALANLIANLKLDVD
ncbi:integrase, catalytic region, zinc finger, CCHC-type containing protein [Tanacetum coccineum]